MRPYTPRFLPVDDLDWVSLVPQIGEANLSTITENAQLRATNH
jgi:hypothetical protein